MNFLKIIREENTEFEKAISGNLDEIPVLGKAFNVYFPVLILVFFILTLLNFYGRILKCLQISDEDEIISVDMVKEGRIVVNRELKAKRRQEYVAGATKDKKEKIRQSERHDDIELGRAKAKIADKKPSESTLKPTPRMR